MLYSLSRDACEAAWIVGLLVISQIDLWNKKTFRSGFASVKTMHKNPVAIMPLQIRKIIMEKLTTIIETTLNVSLGIAVCGAIPALIVFAFFTQN